MSAPVVRFLRLRKDVELSLPHFATAGSAGADLHAALEKDVVLAPGERRLIPTGFAVAIPPGCEGQLRPRSGLALRYGITLPNAPGTIDADYRGELQVILQNTGDAPFVVRAGDRIAQLVICPVLRPAFEEVATAEDLGPTPRGDGGFGHTGR